MVRSKVWVGVCVCVLGGEVWAQGGSVEERLELLEGENRVLREELRELRRRHEELARRVLEPKGEEGVGGRQLEVLGEPSLRLVLDQARGVAWSPDGARLWATLQLAIPGLCFAQA